MVVFILEAIIKIIALHMFYFKDKWNKFDFTIIFLSVLI